MLLTPTSFLLTTASVANLPTVNTLLSKNFIQQFDAGYKEVLFSEQLQLQVNQMRPKRFSGKVKYFAWKCLQPFWWKLLKLIQILTF